MAVKRINGRKKITERTNKIVPLEFEVYVDMTNINDSLELDSGTTICYMKTNVGDISITVEGDVLIFYDDEDYEYYEDFPEELKRAIHNGTVDDDDRAYIQNNNWFEVWSNEDSDVADGVEGSSYEELKSYCLDCAYEFYGV